LSFDIQRRVYGWMDKTSSRFWTALLWGLASACSGSIGSQGGTHSPGGSGDGPRGDNDGNGSSGGSTGTVDSPDSPDCRLGKPVAWSMRRLNAFEYDNTVRDLLGEKRRLGADFEPENAVLGFDNNATGALTTDKTVLQYEDAAATLAATATANPAQFLACDTAKTGEDACVKAFLPKFLRRAFRGTVATDGVQPYIDFYTARKKVDTFVVALTTTVQAVLMAPEFLYHMEIGLSTESALASRLSYFLWGSSPDTVLLDAAEKGALSDPAMRESEARRLLADARADEMLMHFHAQWLQMGKSGTITKDATAFPTWKTISPLAFEETKLFLAEVLRKGPGTLEALFTSKRTFMNKPLADAYKITGPAGTAFEPVSLDGKRRAGVLSQITVLAAHGTATDASIVRRGKFVLDQLLCQELPTPPADIPPLPAARPGGPVTARARLEEHTGHAPCSGCHNHLNPPGFAFEHYDAVGAWRDTDKGEPINSATALTGTDVDGAIDGVPEMAARLGNSEQVRGCVATHWFRYAVERGEADADQCELTRLRNTFSQTGGNVQDLMVAIVTGPAFLQGVIQ
jgi:Protein of unknown function (DUF1592)/Protein of unknown function (DUF1588)/Protein of unknown function (DUF1587)/Protein of unknown function (DUF1585)/Protein of unknown function (DUF1595)